MNISLSKIEIRSLKHMTIEQREESTYDYKKHCSICSKYKVAPLNYSGFAVEWLMCKRAESMETIPALTDKSTDYHSRDYGKVFDDALNLNY